MNTQQLQCHLAKSLGSLAKICQRGKKTEATDDLVLRVLSSSKQDEEKLLQCIEEVNTEMHKITCVDGYESEINFNQAYSMLDEEPESQSRIWHGLHNIAATVSRHPAKEENSQNVLAFIYKTLSVMDEEDAASVLKEMDIVQKICSAR